MTKMRFGIQTSLNNVEWREIEDMWKSLDRDAQFHSAWTFDHFVPPGPGQDANANCFEGWTALAALAAVPDRPRAGCPPPPRRRAQRWPPPPPTRGTPGGGSASARRGTSPSPACTASTPRR